MPLMYRVGRDEVHRSRFYTTTQCVVCQGSCETPSGNNSYLYKYVLVPDGNRGHAQVLPGLVCSDECHRVAHRQEIEQCRQV